MNKYIKVLCLIVTMVMLTSLIVGCGGAAVEPTQVETTEAVSTEAQQTSTDESVTSPDLEWKADTSPITFTAYFDFPNGAFNGWGKDPITTEITKRTGVTIDIQQATTSDSQQLNTMLASGDLPDFIITKWQSPIEPTLWKQGFVLPLNQLMDKHAPKMKNILPKDEEKIFGEADGNLYLLQDYYGDFDKASKVPGAITVNGFLALNMPMYKELGSPQYKTLDDYKNLLLQAKEKYPDLTFLSYDGAFDNPTDSIRNMAQVISRIYGGTDIHAIAPDGTVHMNFRDPSYLKAVQYINDLYRNKLFSAENFTIKAEQFKNLAQNQKIFSYWGQPFMVMTYDLSNNGPYKPAEPPQESGIPLKLKNSSSMIGGWQSVHISKACKNPDRAIKYLEFLISDEGQLLTYYGIEGTHHTLNPNGTVTDSPEIAAVKGRSFADLQTKYGILNLNISWLSSVWVDYLGYWSIVNDPNNPLSTSYKSTVDIYTKYGVNERINELIKVDSDTNEKVIETKILDLWKTSLPSMYLAESSDKCVTAYNDFIDKAEKLGLKDLEKAYTTSYQEWKKKLGQ